MQKFGILILFLFCCCVQIFSQNLTDGQKALESGNFQIARQIFEKLAALNDTNAQFMLASIYEQGKGVEKDMEKAYFWLFLATANNPHLQKYLDRIAQSLSVDSRKKIKNACLDWLAKRSLKAPENSG